MSKTKPAAEPATAPTPTDAPIAPFTAEQVAAIDARLDAYFEANAEKFAGLATEKMKGLVHDLRTQLFADLDTKGAELLKAAREISPPAKPERPSAEPKPDRTPTVHELARLFTSEGVDLDPEQIMTRDDGTPAFSVRDGVFAVVTRDGRKIEVTP